MDWRGFLRPTRGKDMVFTLIAIGFVISINLFFNDPLQDYLLDSLKDSLPFALAAIIWILSLSFSVVFLLVFSFPYTICAGGMGPHCLNSHPLAFLILDVPVLLITAVYWWIISCIIVSIYNKIKTKK